VKEGMSKRRKMKDEQRIMGRAMEEGWNGERWTSKERMMDRGKGEGLNRKDGQEQREKEGTAKTDRAKGEG
jgi:hypothetical protein